MPSDEEREALLRALVNRRLEEHVDSPTRLVLTPDYEPIGMAGEAGFARDARLAIDLWSKKSDGRRDFTVPLRFTIDVKAAKRPGHLVERPGKVTCDIYVLMRYWKTLLDAQSIGWCWGKVLARAPLIDLGSGHLTHAIRAENLRPIDELIRRIMRLV